MFAKLSNSWLLIKASARVLKADKELMVFPVLSAIGVMIVSITFFVPSLLSGFLDSVFSENLQVFGLIVLFLFYVFQYTVIFFMNTALVGAALVRLRGGDPTIADGLRIASQRFAPILGYALIAATVGTLLKTLSDRSDNKIARFAISLIGMAWNIATYLVVPVLAVENVSPIQAIKRSVQLLKQTWGEQIAGNLGMGAIFGLVYFIIILVFCVPIILLIGDQSSLPIIIALVILFVLALVFTGLISSTLNGIYTAAVYQYAADGKTGEFFDSEMIQNAFQSR